MPLEVLYNYKKNPRKTKQFLFGQKRWHHGSNKFRVAWKTLPSGHPYKSLQLLSGLLLKSRPSASCLTPFKSICHFSNLVECTCINLNQRGLASFTSCARSQSSASALFITVSAPFKWSWWMGRTQTSIIIHKQKQNNSPEVYQPAKHNMWKGKV